MYNTIQFPGVAQLVARLLWAKTACAAGGRCSGAFLVQRSIKSRISESPKILSGYRKLGDQSITFYRFPQLNYYLSGCSAVGSAPALGAGCREFESRHSDQKSRRRFCGIWTFLFVWSETRTIKSNLPGAGWRRRLDGAEHLSALGADANESRHSDHLRT